MDVHVISPRLGNEKLSVGLARSHSLHLHYLCNNHFLLYLVLLLYMEASQNIICLGCLIWILCKKNYTLCIHLWLPSFAVFYFWDFCMFIWIVVVHSFLVSYLFHYLKIVQFIHSSDYGFNFHLSDYWWHGFLAIYLLVKYFLFC